MDGKRALLVGSSFSAAPMFFALKRYGLHVSVCGNSPGDPCHQYADASIPIDYSKPEELMRVVESGNFDYLIPTCNDYSYMSCAQVAERHAFPGLDSYATALALHTKNEFRKVAKTHAIRMPRFVKANQDTRNAVEHLTFPLLVKPTDSFSGRGVTKVSDARELDAAIEGALAASRSGEAIVEEFIEGTLHSHSAFIQDQSVALDYFVDEFCTVYPYQVNCSNHPSALPESVRIGVRAEMDRMAQALRLKNGLLHTQFLCKGDQFWIIECMRRCPGDLYGSLVEQSTGVDYADLYVRPFIGMRLPDVPSSGAVKNVGRHTISRSEPLIAFAFSHRIPASKVDSVPLKMSGERLDPAPFDKLAILFAEFESQKLMLETTPKFAALIDIRTQG